MSNRINTAMQTCFFALAEILPRDEAIAAIKQAIKKTYGKRGETICRRILRPSTGHWPRCTRCDVPATATSATRRRPPLAVERTFRFRQAGDGGAHRRPRRLAAGERAAGRRHVSHRHGQARETEHRPGDSDLGSRHLHPMRPLRAGLPACGDSHEGVPATGALNGAPDGFVHRPWKDKELADHLLTIQVAPDDCTGCGVCVDVCPAKSKEVVEHKAINMEPKEEHLERERANFDFFLDASRSRSHARRSSTRSRARSCSQPLFEFSGACAGCGETPYLKLMSQLFGDRAMIGNATGCSSIYGGNLPTTPWPTNAAGPRPGLVQFAVRGQRRIRPRAFGWRSIAKRDYAEYLLQAIGGRRRRRRWCRELCESPQTNEAEIAAQRERRRSAATASSRQSTRRWRRAWRRSPSRWCGAACGSSAATAGPTTSASAAWTTC